MASEPPIVIANRKELTYLLCQAAELEHGVMCQYLYAAFSLKQGIGDQVERWRTVLLRVAADEMLHWALANNLLTAVGSAPFVSRPHMPHHAKGYPAGVQLALVPFGERALRHFLYLERPEGMAMDDADGFEPKGPALPIMAADELLPRGQEFETVGHLYRSIEAGLTQLADRYGPERLFCGPPSAQAGPSSFGWPDLVPVTDLAGAQSVLRRIVEQGEGARGDWSTAHYGRFLEVYDEYAKAGVNDDEFVHPVTAAGCRSVEGVDPAVWISDATTADVSDLFNTVYDLILQVIVRYFAFGSESAEQSAVLADVAVILMLVAIKPLGLVLATLPVGDDHPGTTAGANFQLAYRASFLLPHRRAAWIRFAERLAETADFADGIAVAGDAKSVVTAVAHQCRELAGRLEDGIEPV